MSEEIAQAKTVSDDVRREAHNLLDNKAGKDRIVGKATAPSSGQTCRSALRI